MSVTSDRLSELIEKKYGGWGSKSRFAAAMGVNVGEAHHWITGRRRIPNEKLLTIARLLDTTTEYLLGSLKTYNAKEIPIKNVVSCGAPDGVYYPPKKHSIFYREDCYNARLYGLVASGDGMSPEIEDGDEIVCDPAAEIKHGDIVHYTLRNESAIKVFLIDERANIIRLKPYNPTPEFRTLTIRLDSDEANDLRMAKVVTVHKLQFNNRAARLRILGEV
jgi:SOS-response transcriptional repressor LexA